MALDPNLCSALIDGSSSAEWSTVRILGCRLRKFSLWNKFLLRALQSPFMEKGRPVTRRDLLTAIGVCRLKYPDSHIRRPRLMSALDYAWLVAKATVNRSKPKEGEDNIVQAALRAQTDAFLLYTSDYLQQPEYTIIPPDTKGVPQAPQIPSAAAPRSRCIPCSAMQVASSAR
jgi:hypothetical protein